MDIGTPPWNTTKISSSYEAFKSIYATSPVKNNSGGMKAPHAFATWYMLKNLAPSLVVESGIWKGQGTWLIENACPNADIICLDPDLSNIEYKSDKAVYYDSDFVNTNFSKYDLSNSICFFDDHQNALSRLQQMLWKGFKRAIFEDNYPAGRGDCYSVKKLLGGDGHPALPPESGALQKLKGKVIASLTGHSDIPRNSAHREEFEKNIKVHYEFPPLFKTQHTRWGDPWDNSMYPTKSPLFLDSVEDQFKAESKDYTWICYVELK